MNGSDCRDFRAMPPKMFATDGSEKDPVVVYNLRPEETSENEWKQFFCQQQLQGRVASNEDWFKVGSVGINSLMKTMAQKPGINNERLRNHSGRKTTIQTLSENDFPPTRIAQLSAGHKNLKSIENYSKVSTKQQMQMFKVLRGCYSWYCNQDVLVRNNLSSHFSIQL